MCTIVLLHVSRFLDILISGCQLCLILSWGGGDQIYEFFLISALDSHCECSLVQQCLFLHVCIPNFDTNLTPDDIMLHILF